MSDMTDTIIPKSDQLNADQLLAGPITITVTEVTIAAGEQPVTIHYANENGRPYKPGKSMRRVLVKAWGADAGNYIGRSMTLYTDPTIKFGGMEVGGLRISHLSHIPGTLTMALTETKGRKKPFVVQPLVIEPAPKSGGFVVQPLVIEPAPKSGGFVVQPLVIEPAPKSGGFVEWLASYRDRLMTAESPEGIAAVMGADDKAIAVRKKGTDKQREAMEAVEAEAKAALSAA